ADQGQHLSGDAFLLHTAQSSQKDASTAIVEGVRVITVPRNLVEWLTFELDDSATLTALPKSTFPRLGRYQNLQTEVGASKRALAPAPPPGDLSPSAPVQPPTGTGDSAPGHSPSKALLGALGTAVGPSVAELPISQPTFGSAPNGGITSPPP